jgi:hypothetical protein
MMEIITTIVGWAIVLLLIVVWFWVRWRLGLLADEITARGDKRAEIDRLDSVPRAELERRANSGTFTKSARHD